MGEWESGRGGEGERGRGGEGCSLKSPECNTSVPRLLSGNVGWGEGHARTEVLFPKNMLAVLH